jgi:hypothetical protein
MPYIYQQHRVNTNDLSGLKYFTKTDWYAELELTSLEGELNNMILCRAGKVT